MSEQDHPAWPAYIAALEAAREEARRSITPTPDAAPDEGDPDD